MIPAVSSSNNTQQSSNTTSNTTNPSGLDSMANEQTFLQLFVAQLENQDPLNPQDGAQFVAQLAQFSSLEQELQMREDLDSINKTVTQAGAAQQPAQPPAQQP